MPEYASLRIFGEGKVEVDLVACFLADLKRAYDSILFFEQVTRGLVEPVITIQPPRQWDSFVHRVGQAQWVDLWGLQSTKSIDSTIPTAEQLVLSAVELSSPGFWDFLGTLNPLEVIRKYLSDRHIRRQDKEYRESAEARRLQLENLSLENRVISERIAIAKSIGATDRDLAPLLNDLVYKPVSLLNRYQDAGVIETAELSTAPEPQLLAGASEH